MFLFNRQVGGLPGFLLTLMWTLCLGMPSARLGGAEVSRCSFAFEAADAEVTLEKFSDQSGVQIVYLIEDVRGVTTNPVNGEFAVCDALDRLLAGTVLKAEQDGKTGAYAIRRDRTTRSPAAEPHNPDNARRLPMKKSLPARLTSVLVALGSTLLSAQTGPASKEEEVVELSPFVINAEEDTGYQATNTLAGSRMNTSLRDTAASVSVLTAELLSDIGALNLNEAIAFGNNIELDDTQTSNDNAVFEQFNTFRIRGQAATIGRNYFRWRLPANTFNVERIEEARGPNSILFGIASAGGMISVQTKQASTGRDFMRAQLIYGSYDLRRASVDVNQASANGRFGVRLNAVTSDAQGYQHFVSDEDNRVHLAVKYNLTPNTVIRAEYEKGRTFAGKANAQEIGDTVMRWYNAGRPVKVVTATENALGITRLGLGVGSVMITPIEESPGVFSFGDYRGQGITQAAGTALITDPTIVDPLNFKVNIGGAGQTQASDFDTWSAFIEHKLFKNTYLQLAYNHQESEFHAWQSRNNTGLKGDPNQFLQNGITPNPHAGQMYFENWWTNYNRFDKTDNYRFSVSQVADLGKWGEYRMAGLYEREESRFINRGFTENWFDAATGLGAFNITNPAASANRVFRRHYITLGDAGTYFASFDNPGVSGVLTNVTDPSNPARKFESKMMQAGGFDDLQEQDSFLFSGQAFYFKRKLVVAGGYRADTLYMHESIRSQVDPVTFVPVVDTVNFARRNRTFDSKTKTLGSVYHVLPWLSLRANFSDSRELPDTRIRLTPIATPEGYFINSRLGDIPKGKGSDFGIDLNLLDNKIFIRATRFETERIGAQVFITPNSPTAMSDLILGALEGAGAITAAERLNHDLDVTGHTFDGKSTGYEFSVTANPAKNWRLTANYSITDALTTRESPEIQAWAALEIPYFQSFNLGSLLVSNNANARTIDGEIANWQVLNSQALSTEGIASVGNRREKLSVLTRYTFNEGRLKGLYIGGSARHQGKMVAGAMSDNSLVYANSFTRADAFIGYKFGRVAGLKFLKNLNVQLNVFNVLNQHDPLINRYSNLNAAVLEINRMAAQEPTFWRLAADLAF